MIGKGHMARDTLLLKCSEGGFSSVVAVPEELSICHCFIVWLLVCMCIRHLFYIVQFFPWSVLPCENRFPIAKSLILCLCSLAFSVKFNSSSALFIGLTACFLFWLLSEHQGAVQHPCGWRLGNVQLPLTSGRTTSVPPCSRQVRVGSVSWSLVAQGKASLQRLQPMWHTLKSGTSTAKKLRRDIETDFENN